MTNNLLVFDVGTTGARSVLYDMQGKELFKSYEEYRIPTGTYEQDPLIWWNAIKNTCNQVAKKTDPADIIGICITTQRGTVTLVDRNGKVLLPAATWMSEREITELKDFQKEGGLRRVIPKLLWIQRNRPEIFEQAYKIVSPDSFIYMKLCGRIITDPTNAINGILNMDTLQWDENLAEKFEVPVDLWPELCRSGETIGDLSGDAAQELGLKKGLPIIAGGGDQQCSALGLGVIDLGQAKATTGTGTFVDMVVEHPIPPMGDIPIFSYPHVIQNKWVVEGAMPGTGTALNWFRDNFSQLQTKECEDKNVNIYDILMAEAEKVPPGSEGLLFIPLYIFKKGTIYGLGFGHTRGYFIRALMESAALSAQMYLGLLEGMTKQKTQELRVDGGAMNSDLWCQIFADVIKKPILVAENKDGAALGAAILGFCGCKIYSKPEYAIKRMVRFSKVKDPNSENSKIYKKLVSLFMTAVLDVSNKKRITGPL